SRRSSGIVFTLIATSETLSLYFVANATIRSSYSSEHAQLLHVNTRTTSRFPAWSARECFLPSVPGRSFHAGATSPMLIFLLNSPPTATAGRTHRHRAMEGKRMGGGNSSVDGRRLAAPRSGAQQAGERSGVSHPMLSLSGGWRRSARPPTDGWTAREWKVVQRPADFHP